MNHSEDHSLRFEKIRTKRAKCEELHRNERLIAGGTNKRHARPKMGAKHRPRKNRKPTGKE